ncbi:MAG: hypothetical protein QMD77_05005, partial [Patescibacteria group bacterium]|nr:hypothetical protein [Patescibacteria group bacterium]
TAFPLLAKRVGRNQEFSLDPTHSKLPDVVRFNTGPVHRSTQGGMRRAVAAIAINLTFLRNIAKPRETSRDKKFKYPAGCRTGGDFF